MTGQNTRGTASVDADNDVAGAGGYDLHCHSTFSDGSFSPAELIELAEERGLSGIAITDHDSLKQLARVRALAEEAGFPVLAGVEVSAFDHETGRKVHVLGYGLSATPDGSGPLERIMAETLRTRTANSLWQAWTIAGELQETSPGDLSLDLQEVVETARPSLAVYKQHIMEALLGLPYVDEEYQRVYRRLFKGGGIAAHDIAYPDCREVVSAMVAQGGLPVLAHPGQLDSWNAVPDLVEAGLAGIEAYHPDHTVADERHAHKVAHAYGLFVTGGSDFHGRYGRPAHLGARVLPEDELPDELASLF